MIKTLTYYNENADTFIEGTLFVDMSQLQNKFTSYLEEGSHILDAGCGSGRDSLAFKQAGYTVTAIDGCKALCEKASELLGQPVRHILFQEITEENIYDGIWACATLLHVPEDEMVDVFTRLSRALKAEGIFYASFKYGDFEGERNGRYFTDYTEERFSALLEKFPEFIQLEQFITMDQRPEREERWLNVVLRKKSNSIKK